MSADDLFITNIFYIVSFSVPSSIYIFIHFLSLLPPVRYNNHTKESFGYMYNNNNNHQQEQQRLLIEEPHPGILKYSTSPILNNTSLRKTYEKNKSYVMRDSKKEKKYFAFMPYGIISFIIILSFTCYIYIYNNNNKHKKLSNDKITIINTNNKNRSISSSSTNTYLTKMNSILNVKLHHLNNINTN